MTRYITQLYMTDAKHVQAARPLPDGLHVWLKGYVPWHPVALRSPARMEVGENTDGRYRRYTTSLSYLQADRPAPTREPRAYLAITADGDQWLIGLAHRPYPLTQISDTYPDRTSERSGCGVSVTWVGEHPALRTLTE